MSVTQDDLELWMEGAPDGVAVYIVTMDGEHFTSFPSDECMGSVLMLMICALVHPNNMDLFVELRQRLARIGTQ